MQDGGYLEADRPSNSSEIHSWNHPPPPITTIHHLGWCWGWIAGATTHHNNHPPRTTHQTSGGGGWRCLAMSLHSPPPHPPPTTTLYHHPLPAPATLGDVGLVVGVATRHTPPSPSTGWRAGGNGWYSWCWAGGGCCYEPSPPPATIHLRSASPHPAPPPPTTLGVAGGG